MLLQRDRLVAAKRETVKREVERVETKYQPFIITYDDQERVQLVHNTRKGVQACVDELNNEDRLDRLGVASKHVVTGMTKAAALGCATKNIRVNAVGLGPVETSAPPGSGLLSQPRLLGGSRWLYESESSVEFSLPEIHMFPLAGASPPNPSVVPGQTFTSPAKGKWRTPSRRPPKGPALRWLWRGSQCVRAPDWLPCSDSGGALLSRLLPGTIVIVTIRMLSPRPNATSMPIDLSCGAS
jgi:Enoyl-(Acyl carrier protein) reductase